MESELKEIIIKAPWGNIACAEDEAKEYINKLDKRPSSSMGKYFLMIHHGSALVASWYEGSLEPVLMVHGRQDSAASFIPIVAMLPNTRQYVAVDLPGNGKSDSYPKGLMISRYYFIGAIDYVVRHLGWKRFIYLGHSMGCEIGLYYNAVRPGLISSFIHLDAAPSFQRLQQPDPVYYYKRFYDRYYSNYQRYNNDAIKKYTKTEAVTAVMKARKLTEKQAVTILSRNLIALGDDTYRLSWDPRIKFAVPQNIPKDDNARIFSTNRLRTLFVTMSNGHGGNFRGKEDADQLVELLMAAGNFRKIVLEGEHDHHVTHPEEVAKYVTEFLNKGVKSKI